MLSYRADLSALLILLNFLFMFLLNYGLSSEFPFNFKIRPTYDG